MKNISVIGILLSAFLLMPGISNVYAASWSPYQPAVNTYFVIQSKSNPKLRLDVSGGVAKSDANIVSYQDNGGYDNQKFRFIAAGNGFYKIETALEKNKFLSIHYSGKKDRTNIKLNHPVGKNQLFKLEKNAAGDIRFTSILGNNLHIGLDDNKKGSINIALRMGDKGNKTLFKLVPTKKKLGVAANSAAGKKMLASPGKQCVKAIFGVGYVAKVRWYKTNMTDFDPVTKHLSLRPGAKAVQTDSIAVLGTSCIQRNEKMFAQVSVVGGKFANEAITIAAGTAVGIGGAVACVGTVGAACPVAAAAVTGVVTAAGLALPDAKETFYLGSPGKLEVTGTVWNPSSKEVREYGRGKGAGKSCSADGQCANDTCARDSAREGNKSICCPSGREGLYAGHEYCYGLPKGKICWSNAMCSSGTCGDNLGGLQRGQCK